MLQSFKDFGDSDDIVDYRNRKNFDNTNYDNGDGESKWYKEQKILYFSLFI